MPSTEERKTAWQHIAHAGTIAALYAAVTVVWTLVGGSLSWGPIQLRLSEALCVLAMFTADAVPGLAVGCTFANIINSHLAGLGTFSAFDYAYSALVIALTLFLIWRFFQHPVIVALVVLAANATIAFLVSSSFGATSVYDVVFGTLATAVGARFTWRYRDRPVVAVAGPVISNALIIPIYLPLIPQSADFYVIPFTDISAAGSHVLMWLFGVVSIGIGEAVVMYLLGLPLARILMRTRIGQTLQ